LPGAHISNSEELDLTRWIRAGDLVTWAQACAEPVALTTLLMEQREAIGHVRVFNGLGIAPTIRPEHTPEVAVLSYTGSGSNAVLSQAGLLDILPSHYSEYPGLIASGRLPVGVVFAQVAPADSRGRYSLSLGDEWLSAALERASVVIAEVNEQTPRTHARTLAESEVDVFVHTSRSPVELRRRELREVERRIGQHIAELVEDGSTLQIGLGALPEAVLGALGGHRDLGIHSGVIGDSVADLMEAGVITNARKSLEVGSSIAGSLMGTERLFKFAADNHEIQVRDTRHTHDPSNLAAQSAFVAINSAFEVDLTGQVNAEVVGGRYLGAVGGSIDFLRGAARSTGGVPIVALPASSNGWSRIVTSLSGPVSTPRADAGIVVTEFGVADLRGASLRSRRQRMLEIAHPDHRARLERESARPDR
jgi:acyl-CoA hydrolase